ncbi:hypothetical protein FH972_022052 [Carpinus fangiana]|uniref:Uncharacterized protein n=1 Tax=Carpinus fangiana TaxID=176857 RepID=A0A5N6KR42_9ROSI|nr:hypothetical protein FH972_022052 [Carpinus fangiana]
MSDYGAYDRDGGRDEPRRYRSTRTRPRERGDPEYVEETTYVERGKGRPPQDLVYRGRDRDDDIEDIPRDFPPPRGSRSSRYDDYDDYGPPRRTRSAGGRGSRYDDDDFDDYAGAGAGGAAGYAAGRRYSRRDDRRGGYHSDDGSPPPRRPERRKSGFEETLEGLGLGGVVGALTGKRKDDRDRSGSRDRSRGPGRSRYGDEHSERDRSRSRPKGERRERQWAQAAQAAIVAGAVEAFRVRNEPGEWKGAKGKRIATAAIGAGGIDKLIDRDPDNKTKRHLVEAVLGGLAANRLANGPREGNSRGRSRSRSGVRGRSQSIMDRFRSKSRGRSTSVDSAGEPRARSQSRGAGLAKLAGAGAVAAAGKAIYDRVRSKSRGAKDRRREESEDSYDARRGGRGRDVGSTRDGARSNPDDSAVVGPRGRNGAVGPAAGAGAAALGSGDGNHERKRDSSTSSESSTDMENKRKKMRGKEYLTAALASIATIHAAHGVYQSMESSEKRHKLVAEGEMSKEEARKRRSKAWLQDAAAVGIAALGIKGAFSEWKEMNHQRQSVRELEERKRKRQKRREQRMREARMNGAGAGPDRMLANAPHRDSYGYPPQANGYGGGYDPGFPPPPMGHADRY